MRLMIIDTETAGTLETPFIYDIGYMLIDTDTGEILKEKQYLIEQVWHNAMIMAGKTRQSKRPYYLKGLKGKKIELQKFGLACQAIKRDMKHYQIEQVYAYNSIFDTRAFEYNANFFHCNNIFEDIDIIDIMAMFKKSCFNNKDYEEFREYCFKNNLITNKKKDPKLNAEVVYKFLTQDDEYSQPHTALLDCKMEFEILSFLL